MSKKEMSSLFYVIGITQVSSSANYSSRSLPIDEESISNPFHSPASFSTNYEPSSCKWSSRKVECDNNKAVVPRGHCA